MLILVIRQLEDKKPLVVFSIYTLKLKFIQILRYLVQKQAQHREILKTFWIALMRGFK
jgi:hypothetical protein